MGSKYSLHIYIYIYIYIYSKTTAKQSKTVPPKKIRSNLSKDEKVALKDLSKRDDIIITNADKGGAVVIMDVNDYIREAKRQLNNPRNYNKTLQQLITTL